nr:Gag-Pol polyprotein [Tanacetum cinerariifolium]
FDPLASVELVTPVARIIVITITLEVQCLGFYKGTPLDLRRSWKLKAITDIGIFVGYASNRKGYRIYNKRSRRIMEIIHVQVDELTEPMAPLHINSGLVPDPVLAAPYILLNPKT